MINADQFKAAFRLHPAGVALITADHGGTPLALTASSVAAVSADPPLVMFSVSAAGSSIHALRLTHVVVIHLLSGENLDLALLGATGGTDRFGDKTRWRRLPTGEPVFDEAKTWMRAHILRRISAGGSEVFVATVIESQVSADGDADGGLVYWNRTWHRIRRSTIASEPT
jgi:flavin reductase (DIM6/NTAB) family NADH-FMN oxidoreductase RutF